MTSTNLGTAAGAVPTDDAATPAEGDAVAPTTTEAPRKPRASRRIPKSDAVLEAAVERARSAVLEVAPESQIGRHVSAVIEGERLVTHRFEAFLPGYGGWQWYASVARVARSKDVTVCEVGLLPSAASLVAPEWLPWSQRVRPEDSESDDGVPQVGGSQDGGPAPVEALDSTDTEGADSDGAYTDAVVPGESADNAPEHPDSE
ncbi:hypothetical protein RCH21_003154 [Arthrobacter sp. PL16]|uniref:DUF3027 domain-containing protein n=1 Tax=Arthrobacter sp. PL16 TaxID=3071720 RepID=UPI002E066EF1|nr:hypothetical protein [Arthrobacter sp. PL16]